MLEPLHTLLALKLALFCLQRPLLQPVDAVLALHALARRHVALPLLPGLLRLPDALLALADPLLL